MYTLMEELASQGKAVIMISSELSEIQRLSDRVVVMCEGRKTAEIGRHELYKPLGEKGPRQKK